MALTMRWRDWELRVRRAGGPWAPRLMLLVCAAAALLPGCRSLDLKTARTIARISSLGRSQTVSVRKKVDQPLATHWHWFARGGPTPTPRTRQFLRRFDLENTYRRSADETLQALIERRKPNRPSKRHTCWPNWHFWRVRPREFKASVIARCECSPPP